MAAEEYYFKVLCPYCGYKMNIRFNASCSCNGLYMKCKNRDCKKEFELKIKRGRQLLPNKIECHNVPT